MRREDLEELHYITPIANVPSILRYGILSNRRASRVRHSSVAMKEIQERRARKRVPGGLPLHEYANLYISARNPMLHKLLHMHAELCILRVDTNVLDTPGTVVTDGNAASKHTRFAPAPQGLRVVDRERTFAEWWTDLDQYEYYRKKNAKCAEILIPDVVPRNFLMGSYVSCQEALERYVALSVDLTAEINGYMFFR